MRFDINVALLHTEVHINHNKEARIKYIKQKYSVSAVRIFIPDVVECFFRLKVLLSHISECINLFVRKEKKKKRYKIFIISTNK